MFEFGVLQDFDCKFLNFVLFYFDNMYIKVIFFELFDLLFYLILYFILVCIWI